MQQQQQPTKKKPTTTMPEETLIVPLTVPAALHDDGHQHNVEYKLGNYSEDLTTTTPTKPRPRRH